MTSVCSGDSRTFGAAPMPGLPPVTSMTPRFIVVPETTHASKRRPAVANR